jgi:deazaflavin-dependent oxidoreductase (nitroreductase family)
MWFNPVMIWLLHSPLHGMLSKNTMLIAYTGRKTGKSYVTPVNYLRIDESGTQVLYTTSYRERVWWRNLRGGAAVTLTLRRKAVPAQAAVIEDENEVAKSLARYLHSAPGLARYFQIGMDASGNPEMEDVAAAAKRMVMIRLIV